MKSDWSNNLLTSSPENNRPVEPTINAFDDDFSDILEMDDQMEMAQLFNMVGRARSQGANMSDEVNTGNYVLAIFCRTGDKITGRATYFLLNFWPVLIYTPCHRKSVFKEALDFCRKFGL